MKILSKLIMLLCCCISIYSYAQPTEEGTDQSIAAKKTGGSCCVNGSCCNASQTPLGISTDHVHPKGEWMASYMYMDMEMKGNRTGTSNTADSLLYAKNYMMAPATMSMKMHMVMLMYGVTDKLTLMAMGGYTSFNMTMNMPSAMIMPGMTDPSSSMGMTSSGLTDTKLSALYNFSNSETTRVIGSMGINVPTGSIKVTGATILGTDQRLPYDMQPGTGSWGITEDVTIVHQAGKWAFGGNIGQDEKLNTNSLGYKQGNVYHATTWVGYAFLPFVSGSVRAEWLSVDKISGSDKAMDSSYYQLYDPTTVTSHYGGTWGSLYAGLNFHFRKGIPQKFQLQVEYGRPVYENLNGPQMSVHSNLLAGLQYKF